MKRIAWASAVLMTVGGGFVAAQSQGDQTLTGLITDSMCAQSHDANIEHARGNSGKTMTSKECTNGCVAHRGQKYVFVSNGKVYQVSNQTFGPLVTYAAETVKMSGKINGDTITISRIIPLEKAAGK